jgi:hypothetical protein
MQASALNRATFRPSFLVSGESFRVVGTTQGETKCHIKTHSILWYFLYLADFGFYQLKGRNR